MIDSGGAFPRMSSKNSSLLSLSRNEENRSYLLLGLFVPCTGCIGTCPLLDMVLYETYCPGWEGAVAMEAVVVVAVSVVKLEVRPMRSLFSCT